MRVCGVFYGLVYFSQGIFSCRVGTFKGMIPSLGTYTRRSFIFVLISSLVGSFLFGELCRICGGGVSTKLAA